MKTLTLATASALFLLPSCSMLTNLNPMAGGGGGNQAQAMVDTMKDQKAQFLVQLPPETAVGTWWEHTMAGGTMKMKFQVVAEQDGQFIVENPMKMGQATVVNVFQVDPNVDITVTPAAGELVAHNVTKAWIGAEGGTPVERPVMDVPKMPETQGTATTDFTEGTETVNLGGRDWNAKWIQTADSKSWMVAGTQFLLRAESKGTVSMELTGFGTDAKAALNWEEAAAPSK